MAAGLGFKTFTTGEVLTAADVNGYLMQGVLVFASAAARNAAITSPQEGQFAFTKDTNGLWYYDGAAWVASGATGDIEGVTAGVGITGGGTSGTVTITNDMATTITASGDIVVGTGSGTYDNLPIGTTGQLLTADTTVSPYKVKWATPAAASSALTLVKAETAFSAVANTGTTFDGVFSSTYNNYLIIIDKTLNSVDGGAMNFNMRYSGTTDSGGANTGGTFVKNSSGTDRSWYFNNATEMKLMENQNTAGRFGTCNLWIGGLNSGSASKYRMNWQFATFGENSFGNGGNFLNNNGTDRVWTGFILTASSGTISGTATVYGFGKA